MVKSGILKPIMGLVLALSSLFFISTGFAKPSGDSQYFRHLMFRETPYAPYRGIYPITESESKRVAHYRFDYDSSGRVSSIAHMIGNELIADNGNWDTFVWFAPKVTMEYKEDKEIHRYFNVNGQPIEAHGKVFTAEYTIKDGMRSALKFTDQNGKASENGWNAHRYQWTRDKNNWIVEKRFNLKDEMVSIRPQFGFYETRLQYDDDGKLMFMYNYGLEGKPANNETGAGIDRIYYDHNGNFQRWQVFDKDKNPVEGNHPMVHIGEHLYDSLGNKVGMRGFNKFGAPMAFAWGDFKVTHGYDVFGNQNSTATFDKDGNQKINALVVYSEKGIKRKWVKFVDVNGELVNSPQLGGAAALEFHYKDGEKVSSSRTRYDANMKKVEG